MTAVLERESPETVSAFAAKTHLSRLLHSVEMGQQYLITRRGKPVARLVPADAGPARPALARLVHDFKTFREASKTGKGDLKSLRDGGRRA
ncbi:MAG: type II toxin-antitoxin system prevent-host-death family antitoxin [bacterium]|nr:type II toxin-antitoxin system prevent-host-death family antitoxin [bacterium]